MTPPIAPARPSGSRTVVGLKAFVAAPTVSAATSPAGYVVGTLLLVCGLALVGFVAYGLVLKGAQLTTVVAITFVVLGGLLVLGGAFAIAPDKTKALVGVVEGIAQDLHLPFLGRAS